MDDQPPPAHTIVAGMRSAQPNPSLTPKIWLQQAAWFHAIAAALPAAAAALPVVAAADDAAALLAGVAAGLE